MHENIDNLHALRYRFRFCRDAELFNALMAKGPTLYQKYTVRFHHVDNGICIHE